MLKLFVLLAGLLCFSFIHGQRTYVGAFPELALSIKVKESWKLTGKIESQHRLFSDDGVIESRFMYQHDRTDFQLFLGRSLTTRAKVAIGSQYRLNGAGQNSYRTIQQIGWLSTIRYYRIGHRVRADQTFLDDGLSWRLRYRISSDLPINGQQLDPGEKYLIVSNEMIVELLNSVISLENRLCLGLGWYFKNKHKFETAIDYRLDPIVSAPQRNRVWLKFSFYLNF